MTQRVQTLAKLPQRRRDAHKGDFGHVLVVAGSPGMTGAGLMAASAAARAGAGLVTLALPKSLNIVAEVALSSVMSMPLPETAEGALAEEAADAVLARADDFTVSAIGPGLRRADETQRMVRRLAAELDMPIVVDADGLNALAGGLEVIRKRKAPTILTPHPGEMGRLLGVPAARIQADREGTAVRLAREHGCLLVLKGCGTVVTDGERVCVNETGNPGMASGGMGDVLTGLIAGLLCQGLEPFDAARLAVFVHGLAGDVAAEWLGELSVLAEDVLECVPPVLKVVQQLSRASPHAALDPEDVRRAVMGRTVGKG